jgi:hypothetical protein
MVVFAQDNISWGTLLQIGKQKNILEQTNQPT